MAESGRGLLAARLTASLMPLNSTMIAVAVSDIAHEFDQDPATVTQALVATYLIAAIALQSPGGKLGDRLGHWRMFSIGQGLIGAGAVLGFLAPSLLLLAGSRLLIAAGGAVVVPATLALLRLELPPERRGRAFGSFGATMALAAAAGPILGGVLVDAFGWQAVFVANIPVLAVSALLALSVRRSVPAPSETAFDWPGSALLTVTLVLLVLGAQGSGGSAWVLAGAGLAVMIPFVVWERRAADPVVAFSLFSSLPFTAGTLLIAAQNLAMYALLFELPLVLKSRFDAGARTTGQLLVCLMLAMVITSLIAGRLTDVVGPRPLAVTGSVICLTAVAMLHGAAMTSAGEVRIPLAILGIGLGLSGPAAQTASLSAVAVARSGMAAGVSSTMRYLGGVTGIAILGQVLDLDGSRSAILSEHRESLVIFGGALAVGLACAFALPGRARKAVPEPVEHDQQPAV